MALFCRPGNAFGDPGSNGTDLRGHRLELNTEENVLKESQADVKEQLSLFIDKELKEQAEELFGELGMSVEQAVVLFLKQAVMNKGFLLRSERKK